MRTNQIAHKVMISQTRKFPLGSFERVREGGATARGTISVKMVIKSMTSANQTDT